MICIKCEKEFTATKKSFVCRGCTLAHKEKYGYLDGSSNITKDEAEMALEKLRKEMTMVQMLIDEKSIGEIAAYAEMGKVNVSAFLSRKVRHALKEKGVRPPKLPDKKIEYKPTFPENLYCKVFQVMEYPLEKMPLDVTESTRGAIDTLTPREARVIELRFKPCHIHHMLR